MAVGGAELVDGALGDHGPVLDDADAVAEAFDEVELVGGEDDGDATVGLVAQDLGHDVDGDGVEAGERFVEYEDFGGVDEGGGELDALLVAEGELHDLVGAAGGDA